MEKHKITTPPIWITDRPVIAFGIWFHYWGKIIHFSIHFLNLQFEFTFYRRNVGTPLIDIFGKRILRKKNI